MALNRSFVPKKTQAMIATTTTMLAHMAKSKRTEAKPMKDEIIRKAFPRFHGRSGFETMRQP